MRSHLLEGIVRHRRVRPFAYALEHHVFYVALDLDELDEVPRRIRSISRGRWNLLSFRDEDHLDPPARDLRARGPRAPAHGGTRPGRLAGDARDQPPGPRLRLQSGQLLPVPRWRRRPPGGRSSRSTTPTASGTCTPFEAHDRRHRELRRLDGQGVLRVAVHRDDRPLHGPRPRRGSAAADHDQRGPGRRPAAAHEPGPCSASPDRPHGPADARPSPARDPPDDRPHPPRTRCGCGCAAPGSIDTARRPDDPFPDRRPTPAAGRPHPVPARVADRDCRPPPGSRSDISSSSCPMARGGRSGMHDAEPSAEIHIHDRRALVKLLVGGETGGGEAYMDGLWSSPDLAGLLRWAALNRDSLALSTGWFRQPGPAPTDASPTGSVATRSARAAATSPPTTTSATTSTGRSSTRR